MQKGRALIPHAGFFDGRSAGKVRVLSIVFAATASVPRNDPHWSPKRQQSRRVDCRTIAVRQRRPQPNENSNAPRTSADPGSSGRRPLVSQAVHAPAGNAVDPVPNGIGPVATSRCAPFLVAKNRYTLELRVGIPSSAESSLSIKRGCSSVG